MKFNEYEYEHLDLEKIKAEFSRLIESFKKAKNMKGQVAAFVALSIAAFCESGR